MTKPELVTLIMANTGEYKKTHLMEMYKVDLEKIAVAFHQPEVAENRTADAPALEGQGTTEDNQLAQNDEIGTPTAPSPASALAKAIEKVYEDNEKLVKGRRLDKDEFKATVIEKVTAQMPLDTPAYPSAVSDTTIATMQQLMAEPIAFCPINENERKMLESIPFVPGYEGVESTIDGKDLLQRVKELHNIEIATSRALMVSLKRKKLVAIGGGKNGGGTKTTITLLERGVRHLKIA